MVIRLPAWAPAQASANVQADQDLAEEGDVAGGQDGVLARVCAASPAASCPVRRAQPPVPWASGAVFPGAGRLAGRGGCLVGQDGGQVAVGEPARRGGLAECPVDRHGPVQGGQLDRLAILARTGRRRLRRPRPATARRRTRSPGTHASAAGARLSASRFSAPGGAGG